MSGAALKQNVHLSGVPGVTDDAISVAVITAGTNPLAGDFRRFVDGVQAYFDMVNASGGIYGRKLVIGAKRDDNFVNNEQTVKASLVEDHAFATFVSTPLFGGAPDLAATNPAMPTFVWNINAEFAGKPNLFGNVGANCFACASQLWPYIAREEGIKNVAVLAYGAITASKNYANGVKASFAKYPSAKIAYFDPNLQIGQANVSAEVGEMKKRHVQLVFTSLDQTETLIIGKEMQKQHLDAVQFVNNLYDPQFVRDNAQYLEGYFVAPQFAALESTPLMPVEQDFIEWMGKNDKPIAELPGYGWIAALQLVHGLQARRPELLPEAPHRLAQPGHALRRRRHDRADRLDQTAQRPSGPHGTSNKYAGDYPCLSPVRIRDGKFVPVFPKPGKPFICMTGGRNAPKLTEQATYESFAPS